MIDAGSRFATRIANFNQKMCVSKTFIRGTLVFVLLTLTDDDCKRTC
jgi:hypothetical protein